MSGVEPLTPKQDVQDKVGVALVTGGWGGLHQMVEKCSTSQHLNIEAALC